MQKCSTILVSACARWLCALWLILLRVLVTKPSTRSSPPPGARKSDRVSSPLVLPDVTETAHELPSPMPEPSPPIDLLNLNQQPSDVPAADPLTSAKPSTDASFDLLGAFGDDDSTGIGSAPIPDILPPPPLQQPQPKINNDPFDIFGSVDQGGVPSMKPSGFPPFVGSLPTFVAQPAATTNPSPTHPARASADPFANIADLATGLNLNFNRSTLSGKSPVNTSPQPTQFSSPTHKPSPSSQPQATFMHTPPTPQTLPSTSSIRTPTQPQAVPAQSRPDYSRLHFDSQKAAQQPGTGGSKNSDIFADILGQQGYSFGSKMNQCPRSINEMRKEDLFKDMDPKKVRIMEWVCANENLQEKNFVVSKLKLN